MTRKRVVASVVQIERHGITIMFNRVPVEQIGDVLDRVLRDLGLLEKMHELREPEHTQTEIGGYRELPVPEWEDDDAWHGDVIGFTPTVRP